MTFEAMSQQIAFYFTKAFQPKVHNYLVNHQVVWLMHFGFCIAKLLIAAIENQVILATFADLLL